MKFLSLSPSLLRHSASLFLGLLTLGLLAATACSDDEAAPAPVPVFGIAVASIDGSAPDGEVAIDCNGQLP
jgi:hypothetical protein